MTTQKTSLYLHLLIVLSLVSLTCIPSEPFPVVFIGAGNVMFGQSSRTPTSGGNG